MGHKMKHQKFYEVVLSLVLLSATKRIFSQTDFWQPINGPGATMFALAIKSSGHLFVGTFNNGDNWTAINSGLTNQIVNALAINSIGHIFAVTAGGGVFKSVQPTTAVKEAAHDFPGTFALEQNYPNPFFPHMQGIFNNAETTIQFILPHSGYVTLKVYNSLGIEIKTLIAKYLSVGRHEAKLKIDEMASGAYFYRLQAEELSQTRKFVVAR
jgi:hypothetical protein